MITFPEPSWRTTLAMAHFLRPVPIMVCAANPPGSLDFTNFFKSAVSTSGSATAEEAATMRGGNLEALDFKERGLDGAKETDWIGLWEIWEENEREDKDEVREEIEVAIAIDGVLLLEWVREASVEVCSAKLLTDSVTEWPIYPPYSRKPP